MRSRAECAAKLQEFVKAQDRLDVFLRGEENPDDDFSTVGNHFNSLLSELLTHIDKFSRDEQAYITAAKKKTFVPQHRRRLSRARDRSNSRSSSRSQSRSSLPSSLSSSAEASFASTSDVSMGDPNSVAAAAAAKATADAEAAAQEQKAARLLQLKIEIEAARRRAFKVKLEAQEREAEVFKAAIDEGLASALSEIVTIDDGEDHQVSPNIS